jgi:hypothetical protein
VRNEVEDLRLSCRVESTKTADSAQFFDDSRISPKGSTQARLLALGKLLSSLPKAPLDDRYRVIRGRRTD